MYHEGEGSGVKKSKINAGFLELVRLNDIWTRCHFYRERGNLSKWNEQLDSAWAELGADLKLENKKHASFFRVIKMLNQKISENRKKRNVLNQVLLHKQIFLKRLQNEQGKGTAYDDEDEDDLD